MLSFGNKELFKYIPAEKYLGKILDESKTMTIRDHKKPFKVGDQTQMYWRVRVTKEKKTWMITTKYPDGMRMMWVEPTEDSAMDHALNMGMPNPYRIIPAHFLGVAEITEVSKIELGYGTWEEYGSDVFIATISKNNCREKIIMNLPLRCVGDDGEIVTTYDKIMSKLAKDDGFENLFDFYCYFDNLYNLSEHREFTIYKWAWLDREWKK
jgi:hypothetical protein